MLFGICHTRPLESVQPGIWFGKFSETFIPPREFKICCLANSVLQRTLSQFTQSMLVGNFNNTLTKNMEGNPRPKKNVVRQIRIWYSISTDIIGYAKQYPDGDDRYDYLVLH